MSKRSSTDANSGNPSNIRLNDVNPLWLEASPTERYLLLEDTETGDVLMPLIYMKHVLVANYSRKLAALKNRLVTIPVAGPLANQQGLLYWQWAFESPLAVKVIVRQEIGEATPQGHLRLVLIPIVYNALVAQEELRSTPLFHALHRAMRASTYWPLLLPIESGLLPQLDAAAGVTDPLPDPLFFGPRLLEATAIKYMFMFKDKEEMVASKRNRTTGASNIDNGVLTAAIMGSGLTQTTNLMALMPQTGGQQRPGADPASMEAAAAAAMASAAAMAAAAAAANADDEDDDDDDDPGMGGRGRSDSPQTSLEGNRRSKRAARPSAKALNNMNIDTTMNGGQPPSLPSFAGTDINIQAQLVEAMMQQQLALQQQQQQLPPLPPGLQQPMAAAMKQHALQQQYPSQMQNIVPRDNSFASLMRAATAGNNNANNGAIGPSGMNHSLQGMQTNNINMGDAQTADAVRQLVDFKFQEVVRELMRLKASMMQLYTAVIGVALQQGSLPSELLGAGNLLNGPTNGMRELLPSDMMRAGGGGGGGGGAQQQQQQHRMRNNNGGGGGVSGLQSDMINNQPSAWPPLYSEIQQAGVLPQQGGGGSGGGVGTGTGTTAGAGNGTNTGNTTDPTMNPGVFGHFNQTMGAPTAQEELNLAALNKNTITLTGGDIFPSLSGLLNESYPKDGKFPGSSLSFRDHPSISLPDLGAELAAHQAAVGGGGGGGEGQQQQQQQQGNGNPGEGVNAQNAAVWANAIGMLPNNNNNARQD